VREKKREREREREKEREREGLSRAPVLVGGWRGEARQSLASFLCVFVP
jgi:hypothetical protein